jgi:cholesterol transport system auxiliary component
MTTRRAAAVHLAWLTSGCSSLLAPADTPVAALIDRLPEDVPRAARPRGVLLVTTPTCRPVYDTTRMAYSLRPHEIDFFARHEWAERPGQMLHPLLVRTLEAARCCTAVVTPPHTGAYDFILRSEITGLVQDFATRAPQLRLALRVTLSDPARVLAVHDFALAEPLRQENPQAGVEAANEAVAKALRAIAQMVIDALA